MRLLGIVFAGCGAFLMVIPRTNDGNDGENEDSSSIIGFLCLLGNTAAMAGYVVSQKRLIFYKKECQTEENKIEGINKYITQYENNHIYGIFHDWSNNPISVTAWSYLWGAILMGIACLYYVFTDLSVFTSIDSHIIFPLCYSVFISSSLCYAFLTFGNKYLSSTLVTAFWPLQIATAVILSYIFFRDTISMIQWIGGGCILIGLTGVTTSDHLISKENKSVVELDENEHVDENEDTDVKEE